MMECLKDLDNCDPEGAKHAEKEILDEAAAAGGVDLDTWKQACKRVRLDGWFGPITDEEYNETELVNMPLGRALEIVRRSMQEQFSDIEFSNHELALGLGDELLEYEGDGPCPPNFTIPGRLIHSEIWRWYREIYG